MEVTNLLRAGSPPGVATNPAQAFQLNTTYPCGIVRFAFRSALTMLGPWNLSGLLRRGTPVCPCKWTNRHDSFVLSARLIANVIALLPTSTVESSLLVS